MKSCATDRNDGSSKEERALRNFHGASLQEAREKKKREEGVKNKYIWWINLTDIGILQGRNGVLVGQGYHISLVYPNLLPSPMHAQVPIRASVRRWLSRSWKPSGTFPEEPDATGWKSAAGSA